MFGEEGMEMKSMTAYSQVAKSNKEQSVQVVIRAFNFKYLDIFVRNLPPEDILLEELIKKEIKTKVLRGKVEVFIFLNKPMAKKIKINEAVVSQYITQMKALAKKNKVQTQVNMTDILQLPQAVYWEQKTNSKSSLVMPALRQALNKLIDFKIKQGATIRREMLANLKKLKGNIAKIKK